MMQSQLILNLQEPYLAAEVAYRRELLERHYQKRSHPRHWIPRRPTLHLPRRRRGPPAVA
jgi:hypothetical protein